MYVNTEFGSLSLSMVIHGQGYTGHYVWEQEGHCLVGHIDIYLGFLSLRPLSPRPP